METVQETQPLQQEESEMNKTVKYAVITALVATTGLAAVGASADWKGDRRHCNFGGPGAGQDGGPSMMMKHKGQPRRDAKLDLNLGAEQAKTLVAARLIMKGNARLKVGQVTEKDQDTYLVDVVTVDDSLVRQVEVDRDKGLPRGPRGPRG